MWPPGGSRNLGAEPRAIGEPPSHLGLYTSGLTRFDLLGDFGRFNWLGNFYIVFLYNAAFTGLTTLCLVKTFTAAVRAELIRAFGERVWEAPAGGVIVRWSPLEQWSSQQGRWHALCFFACSLSPPSSTHSVVWLSYPRELDLYPNFDCPLTLLQG